MFGLLRRFFPCVFILFFFQLSAGVKIVTESFDHLKNEKSSGSLLIDGDMVKIDTSEESEQTVIYDLAKKEVIIINHKDKTWMKATKKQIDDSKATVIQNKKDLQAKRRVALAQLSPEQRAEIETKMQLMLGSDDEVPVTYVNTGKTAKWGNSDCVVYDGMTGKEKTEEVCTIESKKLKCSLIEIERLSQIRLDYTMEENDVSEWKDIKKTGVPVIQKSYHKGTLVVTNTFVSFESAKIPADSFKVPAEYKQTASPFESLPVVPEKK